MYLKHVFFQNNKKFPCNGQPTSSGFRRIKSSTIRKNNEKRKEASVIPPILNLIQKQLDVMPIGFHISKKSGRSEMTMMKS